MKSHLLIIYSCRNYESSRVRWQQETWPQRLPAAMTYLLMTGQGGGQVDRSGVLRLDVSDAYEHLIDKTQALFDWFLDEREEPWLVKCDDDVWLSPSGLNKVVNNTNLYAGAYGKKYAGGPLYILHRDAISQMRRLRHFVQDDNVAEDLAVGLAAQDAKIPLGLIGLDKVKWYHHEKDKLVGTHDCDMMFCFSREQHAALMRYAESKHLELELQQISEPIKHSSENSEKI